MAGLDDLLNAPDNTLPGTDVSFIDADTVRINPIQVGDKTIDSVRLQGVLAPETAKLWKGDTGEAGGVATMEQVMDLARRMGYTNLVYDENNLDDTGSRFVGDLKDEHGRSFSQALAREGILDVSAQHDVTGLREAQQLGAFYRTEEGREQTEWDKARAMIDQSIANEAAYGQQFKTAQLIAGDATANPQAYNQYAAAFGYNDRDISTGKSNNPFSDAWDTGLIGVQEAAWGITNLLGEETGFDYLANIGQAGINRARTRIADRGHFITDYKDVNGFGDAVEYLTNNLALSLPYMGITVAGSVAAPFTGGLSLAAPAAIYSGTVWNEMDDENKNAGIAIGTGIAQAALDRIGLGFIFKSGVAPKKLLSEGIEALVARGLSREAAEQTVMTATRKELAGFAGDAARVAAEQIKAKNIFKTVASRAAQGAAGESVTEALQESIGYLAANHTTIGSGVFDWNALAERATQAAIAGGTLGGVFGLPGGLYNAGAWADVAVRQAPAEAKRLSEAGKYAEQEIAQFGRVKSIQEHVADTKAKVARGRGAQAKSLDDRVESHKQAKKKESWWDTMSSTALSAPALWQGATRFIFNDHLKAQSRAARILADMFGGGLQKTFSGSSFENEKHHRVAIYKNMVPTPTAVFNKILGNKRATTKARGEASAQLYAQLNAAVDPDGNFDPDLVPEGENKQLIIDLAHQLQRLSDKMYSDQREHNPDLGYIQNYLFRYKSLSKQAVAKNRIKFQQALVDKFNFSQADAKALTDEILDNAEVADIDDAFSVVKGGIVPGSHRSRSLNLAEQAEFQDFMEQDIFANVSHAAKQAARYTAHRDFIGVNGENIAQLLDEMEAEGVDPAIVNKVAAQMKNYLDAESGNYKRPKSGLGKDVLRLQKNFMMLTTVAGLPLATVSSFVEAGLTMRGLTTDQIFGKRGSLEAMGKELGQTLWDGASEVAAQALRRQSDPTDATYGQQRLRDMGFYEWDVGAATVTGVSEVNPLQQQIYENFFRYTGLTGWTNYTRAIRASIAGDFVADKLDIIARQRESGEAKTNEVQEAEEALRNIGLNIDDMLNNPDDATIEANMREATFNFVNDAVALPQSANRPLIYQDPRFALFTQFQGFIATFTANHIPKLWGEYVKRGTPAMKYNAFAVMTTMIMLGFASQYLKDLIKYGKTTPYLDDAEYLQRGFRASGLLGTGERVLDQFFPLYEQRSDNPGEWFFNETTGQSPALSNLKRLGRATGKLLEGDVGEAARLTAKSAPVVGPFNRVTGAIGDFASGWNFKGE